MKRTVCLLSLIAAALASPPAVMAAAIVKCVAPDGHVTLTDQPCSDGASTVRLDTDDDASARPPTEHVSAPHALPHSTAPARPATRRVSLPRDIATLKAARAQLLLMDGNEHPQRQPRLAVN
jgi:hypothetical protein